MDFVIFLHVLLAPSQPLNVIVFNITSHGFSASWDPPLINSATHYDLYLNNVEVNSTNSTTHIFTSLTPGTLYTFSVDGVNEFGSNRSSSVSLLLLEGMSS